MRRFVVGTGRCGSTLLSRMLSEHPRVLGLFEFFTGLDWGRRFVAEPVDGTTVADIIAEPNTVTTEVLSRGYTSDEITYPFLPTSRYRLDQDVPWVLISCLPRLTPDHDALFDELLAEVRSWPVAPIAAHYEHVFTWLGARFDRPLWIERSGSSIDYVGELVRLYPDAKIVHIHRDGHEAALSIRAHPFYRFAVNALYGQVPEGGDGDDPIRTLLETLPPVEIFGRYWTEQLQNGFAAVPSLGPEQYLAVRFEDLVTRPDPVLGTLGRFFELPPDPAWIGRAASLVRGVPPTRFESLSPAEQDELRAACHPGQVLLGRAATA